ncbi:MAG: hypothetical protein WBW71_02295 [Bacteroidota bacterium]
MSRSEFSSREAAGFSSDVHKTARQQVHNIPLHMDFKHFQNNLVIPENVFSVNYIVAA